MWHEEGLRDSCSPQVAGVGCGLFCGKYPKGVTVSHLEHEGQRKRDVPAYDHKVTLQYLTSVGCLLRDYKFGSGRLDQAEGS